VLLALAYSLPLLHRQSPDLFAVESNLKAAVQKQIADGKMVGFSVAVITDDKISLSKQYGLSNVRRNVPVTQDSEFAIGSVSKQFTASCLLLLQEDHKLSLSDPVGKYFPELTRSDTVTIRDMLNHVSGYRDWYPLDYLDLRLSRSISSQAVLRQYGTMPLDFTPGDYFSYSNTNFLIAARIVEKVSGMRFYDFLKQRILKPLGMSHTVPYAPSGPNFTERYTRFFQAPQEVAIKEAAGWCLGAGGLVSTPEDLAKWDIALMEGRVMQPDSWQQMTAIRTLNSKKVSNYALGIERHSLGGNLCFAHGGGMAGSTTMNVFCPSARAGFALTSNDDAADFGPLIGILAHVFPPQSGSEPSEQPAEVGPPLQIKVAGPSPAEAAKELFAELQSGKLNRDGLSFELNDLITPARVREMAPRLSAWGKVTKAEATTPGERGNMEVTRITLSFEHHDPLHITMFRMEDGKIAEFQF